MRGSAGLARVFVTIQFDGLTTVQVLIIPDAAYLRPYADKKYHPKVIKKVSTRGNSIDFGFAVPPFLPPLRRYLSGVCNGFEAMNVELVRDTNLKKFP
jgi:hypothetical protein